MALTLSAQQTGARGSTGGSVVRLLQDALAHQRAGRLEPAAAGYARVLLLAPDNFEALQLAGALALQRGRANEAVGLLQRALALRPNAVPCLVRLATACVSLGRLDEAETLARRAHGLDWKSADTHNVLGGVLMRLGRIDEAITVYAALTKLWPAQANGWVALAAACMQRSQSREAITACRRALAAEPEHPTALFMLGQAQLQAHDVTGALASFAAQLQRQPTHHLARSFRLFALNYEAGIDAGQLFAEHVKYGQAVTRAKQRTLPLPSLAGRKIRVALLSPDLRRHAVATFLEPLLQHLDRKRFTILLYHDHFMVDEVSRRLRGLADGWRNFVGQSHATVAAAVQQDAPDVLIDLAGHTHHNRLELLAQRLAPVQINYLGYPNTTGLPAVDFRFTDAICDPVGEADQRHTETLVRFAPTAWAYAPPADAPAVATAPCTTGAPFTFGSFNNLSKLNDTTLRLWREVLAAVPNSRLLLKGLRFDETALRTRLEAAGLDLTRVICVPPTATVAEHLAAYAQLDVALDPHAYNGTTTTCEALWMGVPIVTLRGDRHASRVGSSLATAVGHPEWIADTPDDYVRVAVELSRDRARLAKLRAGLREEMRQSPLLDHAAQAARFGAAIEHCVALVTARQQSAA